MSAGDAVPPPPTASGHDPAEAAALAVARARVLERIALACARVGRDPGRVTLVAITKTVPPERVRAALAAGLSEFGENRVGELVDKAAAVAGARWHLVGPLQSNKARRAVEAADVVESVDRLDIAVRLDRLAGEMRSGRPLPVLVQVNVDADPDKAGFAPGDLARALPVLLALPSLRIDGLMTIGRLVAEPQAARPTFAALARLSERLRAIDARLGPELSMGMSDDYEVAVEEGATIVRLGRALFGPRPASA